VRFGKRFNQIPTTRMPLTTISHPTSTIYHLPFTIHQEDKAATAEQNHTAHTVRMCNVLSMCYVLRVMCYVSTPMVRSEFHSLTL